MTNDAAKNKVESNTPSNTIPDSSTSIDQIKIIR
ncbi:hypothetical protein LSO10F_110009 [Candidatus Liberibacter solanacearum]